MNYQQEDLRKINNGVLSHLFSFKVRSSHQTNPTLNRSDTLKTPTLPQIYRAKQKKKSVAFKLPITPPRNSSGSRTIRMTIRKSSSAGRSVEVELAEDVERGDEANEAEAHDEHDGRSDLQAWSVVGVEPQHVVSGTRAAGGGHPSGAGVSASNWTTAAHSSCGRS